MQISPDLLIRTRAILDELLRACEQDAAYTAERGAADPSATGAARDALLAAAYQLRADLAAAGHSLAALLPATASAPRPARCSGAAPAPGGDHEDPAAPARPGAVPARLVQLRALLASRPVAATQVIALVPDYAATDFQAQEYGAWYVGHADPAQLAPDVLQAHFDQGVATHGIDPNAAERMVAYAQHLEAAGYTVYDTAGEGYVCIVTGAPDRPPRG